jgi:lysyl-tRNA synthetase class 1
LDHYATDEERTKLQETLPLRAQELTQTQRAFLHILAGMLPAVEWNDNSLQICVFNAARLTPLDQPSAFVALYRILLDRTNGPKAGNLLSVLDRQFVIKACLQLPVDKYKFWEESSITSDTFEEWLKKMKTEVLHLSAKFEFIAFGQDLPSGMIAQHHEHGLGVIEFWAITAKDKKTHCLRVLFNRFKALDTTPEKEFEEFDFYAHEWIKELEKLSGLKIEIRSS